VIALKPDDSEPPAAIAVGMPGAPPTGDKALDDVDTMIQRLAERLEKNPTDGEGFRMLGWSYVMTGHPDKAVTAYKRALPLLPKQANVHAGYGEALVGVAGGTVTQEAKDAFDKAIAADPSEPRARYFEALWLAQHGQEKAALDKWIALAGSAPADAPWQADLRRQIGQTAAKLEVDVPANLAVAPVASVPATELGAPPPLDGNTVQAASALPAADRQAMVDQMVEGLAKKLQADPRNAEGWVRLMRSRMVLKQGDQAGRDLATARRALAGSAADLAMVNGAAREFGVPGS
jgi:cytochrome c-type biogenesis protein CcmH